MISSFFGGVVPVSVCNGGMSGEKSGKNSEMSIKILLVDDHRIVREGLRSLLERETDFTVVAEAGDGREAVRLAGELFPDVVLMDISMPNMNGIEATRRIVVEYPDVRVLVLSMHSDRRYVVEALNAGAQGFFLKDVAGEDLVGTIRTVAVNDSRSCPKMNGLLVRDSMRSSADPCLAASSSLSPREREVLQLLAEGKNTKEMAFALDVSIKTVETHRQQIMKKLDIRSIAALTKYAIREGLTTLD